MFHHDIKVLAAKSIIETIVDDLWYKSAGFSLDTFNTLLKYGLVEMYAIAQSNFSGKLCAVKSKMPKSTFILDFEQLPLSIKGESDSTKPIPRLSNLCRWSTRRTIALCNNIVHPDDIDRLPIPGPLKRILKFEESRPAKTRKVFS